MISFTNLSEEEAGMVGIACQNGPLNTVIAGRKSIVEKVLNSSDQKGTLLPYNDWFSNDLNSPKNAFHSPLMKNMEREFGFFLETLDMTPLQVPVASTVSGKIASVGQVLDVDHWVK